jgi:hypothetical protein
LTIFVSPYPERGPAAMTPSRTCSVTGTTFTAEIAFDLDGGFRYGTVQISSSHPATGPVTAETGRFAAATRTITGTVIAKNDDSFRRRSVTARWRVPWSPIPGSRGKQSRLARGSLMQDTWT